MTFVVPHVQLRQPRVVEEQTMCQEAACCFGDGRSMVREILADAARNILCRLSRCEDIVWIKTNKMMDAKDPEKDVRSLVLVIACFPSHNSF